MSKTEQPGCVYILTNPSFREDWVKIGMTERTVDVRSKELDNTAVPLPFEIYATMETSKFNKAEKIIHKTIDRFTSLRIRQNREFFNIPPEQALDMLKDFAELIDDAKIVMYKGGKPINDVNESKDDETVAEILESKPNKKRSPFKFSMCGIKIGEEIVFNPTGEIVKVASDNQIEYNGRIWTLSAFAGTFMPDDKRCPSDKYGGPIYFSYKGKILDKIRKEHEEIEFAENGL